MYSLKAGTYIRPTFRLSCLRNGSMLLCLPILHFWLQCFKRNQVVGNIVSNGVLCILIIAFKYIYSMSCLHYAWPGPFNLDSCFTRPYYIALSILASQTRPIPTERFPLLIEFVHGSYFYLTRTRLYKSKKWLKGICFG